MGMAMTYRKELLVNPEKAKSSSLYILGMCVMDYGVFNAISETTGSLPTESDYNLHFSFNLLKACCLHDKIPPIIPRMLMNNIAIKLATNEIEFVTPRHQNWALQIFDSIRSDLVPDFISKLKINHLITPQILLDITQKQFN
jgi:hypothetical protein